MEIRPERRKFLRKGCALTAAAIVTLCGGGAAVATIRPTVDLPETSIGEKFMENRVLVAYASKAGSTAEIATKIGESLARKYPAVDVLPVNIVKNLSPYQTVILGSAIRVGNVLPEVKNFIEANKAVLAQKGYSMFIVCMTLSDDTDANRSTVSAYLDPIRVIVKPAREGMFGGVMNVKKLPLIERMMIKMMKSPEGDFRNWEKITAWAEAITKA
jgi:menaquinone-dependent protoporphyrinogen oxidase